MTQSRWLMFLKRKCWRFPHQQWPLQRGESIFESLLQCYTPTLCRQPRFNQQKDCSPITAARERDISISNHSHFHTNTEAASETTEVWQIMPPVFFSIAAHKFPSLLLPVWLMSVIMTLLLFTQHIYPSPPSAMCWLTSSAFYWSSLVGQFKRAPAGLWNVTALSLLFICEIGAEKGKFQGRSLQEEKRCSWVTLNTAPLLPADMQRQKNGNVPTVAIFIQ